jgi:hypothetical protein
VRLFVRKKHFNSEEEKVKEFLVVTVIGGTCLVCAPGCEEHKQEMPFTTEAALVEHFEGKGWERHGWGIKFGHVCGEDHEVLILGFAREKATEKV